MQVTRATWTFYKEVMKMLLEVQLALALIVSVMSTASGQQCGVPQVAAVDDSGCSASTVPVEATPHSWPWVAHIKSKSCSRPPCQTTCGATLIDPSWAMTAASCFSEYYCDPQDYVITFGDHDTEDGELSPNKMQRNITQVVRHRLYERVSSYEDSGVSVQGDSVQTVINNIALVRLETPVTYSDDVQPVCIPEKNDKVSAGAEVYFAGWGHVSRYSTANSSSLRQMNFPTLSIAKCNEIWQEYNGGDYQMDGTMDTSTFNQESSSMDQRTSTLNQAPSSMNQKSSTLNSKALSKAAGHRDAEARKMQGDVDGEDSLGLSALYSMYSYIYTSIMPVLLPYTSTITLYIGMFGWGGETTYFLDDQICAGCPEGSSQHLYFGDEGLAIVKADNGTWTQVGIASFGLSKKLPSGFTNVANYIDWIKKAKEADYENSCTFI